LPATELGAESSLDRLDEETRNRILGERDRVRELDCYAVLNVPRNAPLRLIRRSYHGLTRRFHPDAFFGKPLQDLEEVLLQITQIHFKAYETLRDPARRRRLDLSLATEPEKVRPTVGEKSPALKKGDFRLDAEQQFERGLTYYRQNDYVKARPYLELACAYDPDNPVYREHRDRVRSMLDASETPRSRRR